MKWTIKKKINLGFSIILLILAALASISYYQITVVDKTYTELINDKAKKLSMIKDLEITVKDEQTSLRGYLLTEDETALHKYQSAAQEYMNQSNALGKIIKHPKAKTLLSQLNQIEKEYKEIADKTIKLKQEKKTEEYAAIISGQGKEVIERFSLKAEELTNYQQAVLDNESVSTTDNVYSILNIVLLLSIAAILIGFLIAFYTAKIISKPIIIVNTAAKKIADGDLTADKINIQNKDEIGDLASSFNKMAANLKNIIQQVSINADHVAATSEELSASSEQTSRAAEQITISIQEVSANAEKQFTNIEKTSLTINKMAAGINQIANNAQLVAASASETSTKAAEGDKSIHTAIQQMNSIQQNVQSLSTIIAGLGNRSMEINEIINVITNISAQTNLLALNAAIEAARAGEHGRGFSVVADEVRKLAEQAAISAQQIAELIKHNQEEVNKAILSMNSATKEVSEGIHIINDSGNLFAHIEGSIKLVTQQIQEVSTAVQEMAEGSEHIIQTIDYVTGIGESTASNSQEVSAATEEQLASIEEIASSSLSLSQMAEDLQTHIRKFKIQK
ncbi:methyl-accepting chemotaxis protein [Niallia sp. NCCP-28]|uniref:methyl-accepting chemotaxis protein n=1 Tax=Niallia sp. NCCP-28 TaxID=2934712 RepID=UPI00208A5EA2|nr:methyl-accepting chemotaxis protein [Niallia sp. NCCP-28]GKU83827.1 hypothetical protein NCCP28_32230 [Niallia sp. NCCP-28]